MRGQIILGDCLKGNEKEKIDIDKQELEKLLQQAYTVGKELEQKYMVLIDANHQLVGWGLSNIKRAVSSVVNRARNIVRTVINRGRNLINNARNKVNEYKQKLNNIYNQLKSKYNYLQRQYNVLKNRINFYTKQIKYYTKYVQRLYKQIRDIRNFYETKIRTIVKQYISKILAKIPLYQYIKKNYDKFKMLLELLKQIQAGNTDFLLIAKVIYVLSAIFPQLEIMTPLAKFIIDLKIKNADDLKKFINDMRNIKKLMLAKCDKKTIENISKKINETAINKYNKINEEGYL